MTDSATAFTDEDLRQAAGKRSYDRGLDYLGAVSGIEVVAGEITATVYGSDDYDVTLTLGGDGVDGVGGDCTCPYGQEGNFCKHCVAVGLAVLRAGLDLHKLQEAARSVAAGLDTWLESLPREDLIGLLREQIAADRELRRRLALRAAGSGSDLAVLREEVLRALEPGRGDEYGYLTTGQARAFANRAGEAVAAIDALMTSGRAAEAAGLAAEAIRKVNRSLESAGDPAELLSGAAYGLAEVHLRACLEARPDPVELADFLADCMLRHDFCDIAVDGYDELLGAPGLARLRERVKSAWEANPSGWLERQLMESFLRAEGDVDALVDLLAADHDGLGRGFLRIARELDAVGRGDEALRWAERGLHDVPKADPRLVDYVVNRLLAEGRAADAVALRRREFERDRSLANFRQLRLAARTAGAWPVLRDDVMDRLRRDTIVGPRRPWVRSVWIDALIDDGDVEAAWRAAPEAANDEQWQRLADLLKATRPADALEAYLRLIESLKTQTGDPVYERMAGLLGSARECWLSLGQAQECRTYLADLRTDQKRKRNLMRVLDRHGL